MKRTHMIHVVTDHGCAFKTRHRPDVLAGCTMDCRCGMELIFPHEVRQLHPAVRIVRARDFHQYLHEESEGMWPSDGTGTGWVEIGTTDGGGVVFFRPDARNQALFPTKFRDERGNVWEDINDGMVVLRRQSSQGVDPRVHELSRSRCTDDSVAFSGDRVREIVGFSDFV